MRDALGMPVLPDDFPLDVPAGTEVVTSVRLPDGKGWAATLRFDGSADPIMRHLGDQLERTFVGGQDFPDLAVTNRTLKGRAPSGCQAQVNVYGLRERVQVTIVCER